MIADCCPTTKESAGDSHSRTQSSAKSPNYPHSEYSEPRIPRRRDTAELISGCGELQKTAIRAPMRPTGGTCEMISNSQCSIKKVQISQFQLHKFERMRDEASMWSVIRQRENWKKLTPKRQFKSRDPPDDSGSDIAILDNLSNWNLSALNSCHWGCEDKIREHSEPGASRADSPKNNPPVNPKNPLSHFRLNHRVLEWRFLHVTECSRTLFRDKPFRECHFWYDTPIINLCGYFALISWSFQWIAGVQTGMLRMGSWTAHNNIVGKIEGRDLHAILYHNFRSSVPQVA
jgi:hypothetical protein